jgi:secreted Zn-dependent insulinase-like peptidase
MRIVFAQINSLREDGPPEYIFNENKTMAKINYDYATRGGAMGHAKVLSGTLRQWDDTADYEVPIEDILQKRYIHDQFRSDKINEILNCLIPS